MDLLAALVFAYVIISVNDYSDARDSQGKLKDIVFAGMFAGVMLGLIYYVLIIIGVSSRNVLAVFDNGGIALAHIFNHYLGKAGTLFFALTITLACLKTAIGLIIACSNYFSSIIPKISYQRFAYIVTGVSLFVSNIGLNAIIKFAVPVLNFIYPLAIMHVIYGLIFKQQHPIVNRFVLYITMIASVLEVLGGLPILLSNSGVLSLIVTAYQSLPLGNLGLAWINFSILGIVLGYLFKVMNNINNYERS